jgi:hypothetical protein
MCRHGPLALTLCHLHPAQIAGHCDVSDDSGYLSDDYLTKPLSGFDRQDITGRTATALSGGYSQFHQEAKVPRRGVEYTDVLWKVAAAPGSEGT